MSYIVADSKISSFEQLIVWQKAAEIAVQVYKITKQFPAAEKFSLTDQVQRSAVSISANIAEGFGRLGKNEKLNFYNIAYGSRLETKSHLLIAQKIGYLENHHIEDMNRLITDTQKLINASRRTLSS